MIIFKIKVRYKIINIVYSKSKVSEKVKSVLEKDKNGDLFFINLKLLLLWIWKIQEIRC